jgi:hypothetical protein
MDTINSSVKKTKGMVERKCVGSNLKIASSILVVNAMDSRVAVRA